MGNTFCIDMTSFILDDDILESPESFRISLQSVTPCGNVGSNTTIVEITDNDSKFLNNFCVQLVRFIIIYNY